MRINPIKQSNNYRANQPSTAETSKKKTVSHGIEAIGLLSLLFTDVLDLKSGKEDEKKLEELKTLLNKKNESFKGIDADLFPDLTIKTKQEIKKLPEQAKKVIKNTKP